MKADIRAPTSGAEGTAAVDGADPERRLLAMSRHRERPFRVCLGTINGSVSARLDGRIGFDWNGYLIHCLSLTSGSDIGHFQDGKEASKGR